MLNLPLGMIPIWSIYYKTSLRLQNKLKAFQIICCHQPNIVFKDVQR